MNYNDICIGKLVVVVMVGASYMTDPDGRKWRNRWFPEMNKWVGDFLYRITGGGPMGVILAPVVPNLVPDGIESYYFPWQVLEPPETYDINCAKIELIKRGIDHSILTEDHNVLIEAADADYDSVDDLNSKLCALLP